MRTSALTREWRASWSLRLRIGLDFLAYGNGAGLFEFDKDMTSSNGLNTSTTDGSSFASFLLGYPSSLANRQSSITVTTPVNLFKHYYGTYAQDDWRINSKLTVNYGLRIEHETGMAEKSNNFTVGFDRNAINALSTVVVPADPVAGTPARTVTGGLLYAGVDGNPTTQGDPPAIKWSPRVGAAYTLNDKTVIRGGYGIYWAPYNYPAPSSAQNNYGQVGYTQNTTFTQSVTTPVTYTNPFPAGLIQPSGNSQRTLAGVGSVISYVDQTSGAPRVQQYSVDVQRQLTGSQSITVSYMGSRGDSLALGGSADAAVNINQLDPRYLVLGAALRDAVPNPFFGNANAGASLASQRTVERRQLLRPYPQFLDINARHVLEGKSRYNAAIVEWSKRVTGTFGGRVSYTYSNLKDNQMAETNFYSEGGLNPLNNYNYMNWMPACTTTNFEACYNADAEFGTSLLDVPHRVIIAPIVELPFGRGKAFMSSGGVADWILGGWTVSAAINLQSGFPVSVQQGDNNFTFSGVQRPNVVPGVDPATAGSYADRLASADHPTARWVNDQAFSLAAPYTFGNAPRTLTDVRTPGQYNVDAVFIKNVRMGTKGLQFKMEALNLINRVQVRSLNGRNTFGTANFGQTNIQAGFMRIMQFMLRFNF